jgi:hypothetical protein
MIVKILPRKDASDALDYGAQVGQHASKKRGCPANEITGSLVPGTPLENYYEEFARVLRSRPEIKRNVVHLVISFTEEDKKLGGIALTEAAQRVLTGLGYGDCPFRVTEHVDKRVQHLHIITTAVTYFGERVDRTNDRWRGQSISREFERDFGLWRAPNRRRGAVLPPLSFPIPSVQPPTPKSRPQTPGWEHQVGDLVRQVLRPGITLPQLRDELAPLGVELKPKWTKDNSRVNGLWFRFRERSEPASAVDLQRSSELTRVCSPKVDHPQGSLTASWKARKCWSGYLQK